VGQLIPGKTETGTNVEHIGECHSIQAGQIWTMYIFFQEYYKMPRMLIYTGMTRNKKLQRLKAL
jgi:hypothetical protein